MFEINLLVASSKAYQAKICHFELAHVVGRTQDVLWLEVPVHDAPGVQVHDCIQ